MCGQMRHTILADRRLIGRPSGGFSQKSAAGGPDQRCFPPSVFPLWNPPFLIPPSNSNTPKGENRRGQQRGVFTGAAEETAGSLSPSGAAPRRPSGCQGHSAAHPPLRQDPRGVRRVGRASMRFAHSPPFQPFKVFASSPMFQRLRLNPLAPYHPQWGWARWFRVAAGLARKSRSQNMAGEIP